MHVKKSIFISSLVVSSLIFGAIGVYAGTGIQKIQASLNHNISFTLNGSPWSPKDNSGSKLSALVYDGSTYVPLKSVSEALGASVNWNGATSVVSINGVSATPSTEGIPYKDAGTSTPVATDPTASATPTISGGIISYRAGFSLNSVNDELKPEALSLIKIFANSLVTNDTTTFNNYVNTKVKDTKNSRDYTVVGRQRSIEKYAKEVKDTRYYLDDKVQAYASALSKISLADITSVDDSYPNVSEYSANLTYTVRLEELNSYVTVYISFANVDDIYYLNTVSLRSI